MKLAIIANEELKEELMFAGVSSNCTINWVENIHEVPDNADAVIDLLFEENGYDVSGLQKFLPKPVFVNSINKTIGEIGFSLIRINGWPGFLKRSVAEVAGDANIDKKEAEKILLLLNRKTEWVPDVKGFVSARVVSLIINEAYFALDENVSTKSEIDIAMTLGTNYPLGPFEWAKKIGLKRIAGLLNELSKTEKRFEAASLLVKEAKQD